MSSCPQLPLLRYYHSVLRCYHCYRCYNRFAATVASCAIIFTDKAPEHDPSSHRHKVAEGYGISKQNPVAFRFRVEEDAKSQDADGASIVVPDEGGFFDLTFATYAPRPPTQCYRSAVSAARVCAQATMPTLPCPRYHA